MPEAKTRDPVQLEAIALSCNPDKRISAVTGEAGTGKTDLLKESFLALTDAGYKVALTAPTGKAAKRVTEATGIPAMTNHRLLKYSHPGDPDPKTGKVLGISVPRHDRLNPLPYDFVFGDEYAMVNNELHRNLLDALPAGGRIRAYGDINQLKPIEPPGQQSGMSPFETLLAKFPSVRLTENYRQSAGSGIVENGHLINKGRMPVRRPDFDIKVTDDPVKVLKNFVLESKEAGIDFCTVDHQIIVPIKKATCWVGSIRLNASVQSLFFDTDAPYLTLPRHPWAEKEGDNTRIQVGSKVIYTSNIYAHEDDPNGLEIFNGETGIVTQITEFGEVEIDLGDRIVMIPPLLEYVTKNEDGSESKVKSFDPRKDIELAYVLTTHKTQGSEYQNVVYLLNKSSGMFMVNRRNTYTGITRARKHVTFITDQFGMVRCATVEKTR